MSSARPTYEELERRCLAAEALLAQMRAKEAGMASEEAARLQKEMERTAYINKVLLAIRNVHQVLTGETDACRLIERACAHLTGTMGCHNAWSVLLDVANGTVCAIAASEFNGNYAVLREHLHRGEFSQCMRRTLHTGGLVVIQNPPEECPDCPLSAGYAGRAGFVRRLDQGSHVFGILAVSVPEIYARDEELQELFNVLATDISFCLGKIQDAQTLAQTHRQFREIFNRNRDGYVVVNPDGRITDANNAFCAMLGYSLDELREMPTFYQITPERWHAWEAEEIWKNRLLGAGYSGVYEKEYRRKDGGVFPVELQAYTVAGEDGAPQYLWAVVRDVTERKQAEEALLESDTCHRAILQTAMDGYWLVDLEGRLLEVNDAYCQMSGYCEQELLAMRIADLEAVERPADTLDHLQKVAAGRADRFETRHRRKDGACYDVEVSVQYRPAYGGRIVAFLRDITERKTAERAQLENEEQLRRKLALITSPGMDIQQEDLRAVLDVPGIQQLMDAFYAVSRIGIGIVDLRGQVLVASGWQDICTHFHRIHPKTRAYCVESDLYLAQNVREGEFALYKCKNGMWDMVTPIVVEGKHFANLFLGQFFFDDEKVDWAAFAQQAAEYGFDEAEYMAALDRVPRWSKKQVQDVMEFYTRLAGMLARLSFGSIKLAKALNQARLAQEALKESEARYSSIVHMAQEGIWAMDAQHRTTFVNAKMAEMLGYSPEEMIGKPVEYFMFEDDADDHQSKMAQRHRGQDQNYERRFRRKDGTTLWTIVSATASIGPDAVFQGSFAMFTDITARKQMEEELRKQRDLANRIIEDGPMAITILNTSGVIEFANRHAESTFALTASEIVGRAYNAPEWRIVSMDGGPFPVDQLPFHRITKSGKAVHGVEHAIESPDGVRKCLRIHGAPLTNAQGGVERIIFSVEDITEENQAKEALKTAHHNQRAVMASLPVGLLVVDEHDQIIDANPAAERMFGKTLSQMQSRRCGDFLGCINRHEDARGCGHTPHCPACPMLDAIHATFATGAAVHDSEMESILEIGGQSTRFWLRFSIEPVALNGSRHVVAAIQDISALRRVEQQYQNLFREMLDGFALHEIICDAGGKPINYRFLSVNPAFERLTGQNAQCLVGKTVLEAFPKTEHHWIETYGRVALTGQPAYFEEYAGELDRYFRVAAFSPASNQFACIFSDITERKRAEMALWESQRLYHSLVENLPQSVFRKDRRSRFTFVNGVFCRTLGKTEAEILGKTDFDFYPAEIAAKYQADDRWVMETGQFFESEEMYCAQDNRILSVQVIKTPLRDADENITGIQGVFWDITDRKQLEERLRQAQKMESIGTLAGGIAHDFNNILQTMLVYADLTLDDLEKGSPAAANLEEILAGAKRARDLVARILTFSRQSEEQFKIILLQPLLKEALKLLRGTLPTTIEIREDINPACGPIYADATSIHQVVMNLGTNAYHAMRENGGVLGIQLSEIRVGAEMAARHPDLHAGIYAQLRVSDTGCGMDNQTLTRIFDPYFTTKKVGEGSGLGLAVVHGIVKKLNGAVLVESAEGVGSAFTLLFPVDVASAIEPEKKSEDDNRPLSGSEHILIVDDEIPIARSMANALKKYGYQVETCSNSLQARELFHADPGRYHVVVTDQTMPWLTGMQLAHELLQLRPDLPVILCTGHSDLVDEASAKTSGVRTFLAKPFLPEVLVHAVRRILDAQKEEMP